MLGQQLTHASRSYLLKHIELGSKAANSTLVSSSVIRMTSKLRDQLSKLCSHIVDSMQQLQEYNSSPTAVDQQVLLHLCTNVHTISIPDQVRELENSMNILGECQALLHLEQKRRTTEQQLLAMTEKGALKRYLKHKGKGSCQKETTTTYTEATKALRSTHTTPTLSTGAIEIASYTRYFSAAIGALYLY